MKATSPRSQRRSQRQKRTSPLPTALVFPRTLSLALLALVLVAAAAVRIRMLGLPLERDEGEYAYAGQLILQGVPPYLMAYNMKLPGIYAAYALVLAVFGQSARSIHWGLLLVNAGAVVLVFALAKRLLGTYAGIVAAAAYTVLSASRVVQGMAAHATHFVVLPALGALLLLLEADKRDRSWAFFGSGILFGLAFLMKQHGVMFILFGLVFLVSSSFRRRQEPWARNLLRIVLFSAGMFVPFGLTCLLLLRAGIFDKFWFWTFSYAREYVNELSLADGLTMLGFAFRWVVVSSIMPWVLAGAGLIAMWWRKDLRAQAPYVSGLLAFSFLAVCPGFYFRPHYFVLLLPAVAILVGAAVTSAARFLAEKRFSVGLCYGLSAILFAIPFGQFVYRQRHMFFELTPYQACRRIYGVNPFPEAQVIARYLSEHSRPSDRIAVLGSEPEIFFLSHRRSATGYIYTYGLVERQPYAKRMQREMIREIEEARPEFFLFVGIPFSWLAKEGSEKALLDWYVRYTNANYRLVGIVDIPKSGETVYRWDGETEGYAPGPFVIYVFRRKT